MIKELPLNRLLLDRDRVLYEDVIQEMFEVVPEMMSRKIGRANIQQAYILSTIRRLIPDKFAKGLSIGCFEDTAYGVLVRTGYNDLAGIDPETDYTLEQWWKRGNRDYQFVFATSVIEHTNPDEHFLSYFCDLIKPGGFGVLTMDFNKEYKPGDLVPNTVEQQYRSEDLRGRLQEVLDRYDCSYLGTPNWEEGEMDFTYCGFNYCFASMVFQKSK